MPQDELSKAAEGLDHSSTPGISGQPIPRITRSLTVSLILMIRPHSIRGALPEHFGQRSDWVWVERATGPSCRATSPTAERTKHSKNGGRLRAFYSAASCRRE